MNYYQLIASGRVQGVGFRYHVYQVAQSLNLAGQVKNLPSGRVEIKLQATPEQLETFKRKLNADANPWIHLERLTTKTIPEQSFNGEFTIAY